MNTGDVKTVSTDSFVVGQIVLRRTEGSEDFLYLVGYDRKVERIRTGFAIANPGTAVAQVTYELTDLNGAPVGNALTIDPSAVVSVRRPALAREGSVARTASATRSQSNLYTPDCRMSL